VRAGQLAQEASLAYAIRKSAPYVPTSICVGKLLFLWGDDGAVSCVQAASGEVAWQERLGKHFFCSPVCVAGRLFCVSTTGEVVVIRAADRFELLARNALDETTHSTPAVAGGRMYIHTSKHLVSIGGRAGASE
jgi:outer membrane protein assembly factor BamB